MLKNYLTIAIRHLWKQKEYAVINVLGLAIGMACTLLILMYVYDEINYDRFNDKADRMYRVVLEQKFQGERRYSNSAPSAIGKGIRDEYPEVETTVRYKPPGLTWMLTYEDKGFYEAGFFLADSTVFDIFSLPLIKGNPKTALTDQHSVVLSESMVRKYFGDEDPMGKVIRAEDSWDYTVTGVMRDVPTSSHIQFDFLASFTSMSFFYDSYDDWQPFGMWVPTYVLLREGTAPDELERKLPALIEKHLGKALEAENIEFTLRLEPITDIHLYWYQNGVKVINDNMRSLYLFSGIGLLILLIACINFMNLATARSAGRAREIGVRKVLGAYRRQLIVQFIGEAVLFSTTAVFVSYAVISLFLPWYGTLVDKVFILSLTDRFFLFGVLLGVGLIVGLISGSYPAMVLAGFRPAEVLKGRLSAGVGSAVFRSVLVVVQFAISIVLIITTAVVYNQLDYISNKKLGFDQEHIIAIPLSFDPVLQTAERLKERLIEHPDIVGAAAGESLASRRNRWMQPFTIKGAENNEPVPLSIVMTDWGYADALGLETTAGRFFTRTSLIDQREGVVLNETAVKHLGWTTTEEALDQRLTWHPPEWIERGSEEQLKVIGVVKDFHPGTLHEPIPPMVIFHGDGFGSYVLVRLAPNRIPEALEVVQNTWREINPNFAFAYSFMDEEIDKMYLSEQKQGQIFGSFALVAVLIACLGLYGLASFTAERRTKEIGVRKTVGASVGGIVMLLCREFARLVLIANVIAWPVAYWIMSEWLSEFAYRIELSGWIFILSALGALAIALCTVSYHAVRAASTNPVEALQDE